MYILLRNGCTDKCYNSDPELYTYSWRNGCRYHGRAFVTTRHTHAREEGREITRNEDTTRESGAALRREFLKKKRTCPTNCAALFTYAVGEPPLAYLAVKASNFFNWSSFIFFVSWEVRSK